MSKESFSHDHSCRFNDETDKSSVCLFDDCDIVLGDMLQQLQEFDEAIPYDLRY